MQNLVREDIKDLRLQQLQALLTQQALTINQSFIGKLSLFLFDRPHSLESNKLHGRTQYNQAVHVELPSAAPPRSLEGQVLDVTVTHCGANGIARKYSNNPRECGINQKDQFIMSFIAKHISKP